MTDSNPIGIFPKKPDVALLKLLHRGHDGYVTIHYKDKSPAGVEKFHNLAAVKATELDYYLPGMSPFLETDSYFSANGFWRPGSRASRFLPDSGLREPDRTYKNIRWITSVYADLDGYKSGKDVYELLGMIHRAQAEGKIPAVSVYGFSGRGLWCYWIIRDPKTGGPVSAYPEKRELFASIQQEITSRIHADAASRDICRITRVPGSINSKANARVGYLLNCDESLNLRTHTIAELAEFFGIRQKPISKKAFVLDQKMRALGRRGAAGRWRHDYKRFRFLWTLRRTWRCGLRNKAATIFNTILRSLRREDALDEATIREELTNLWRDFEQPPLADHFYPLEDLFKIKKCGRPLHHTTFGNLLEITEAEAAAMADAFGKGSWPAAGTKKPKVEKPKRRELREKRINALKTHYAAQNGRSPTLDEYRNLLVKCGLDAALATIRTDLQAAGIANPRAWHRKKKGKNAPKLFSD